MSRLTTSIGRSAVAAVLAGALAAAPEAGAQPRVTVQGTVYDSVRGAPLAGAFVTILGRSRSALTDERGRFRFDTLPPGTYVFAAQHDELDSLGLSGLSARATIAAGRDEVLLAVPSFATLWRTACPGPPPRDSGFVYGTVRDARTQAPVAGAEVVVSWIELRVIDDRTPGERRWRRATRSDSTGGFGVCGTPTDVGVAIRAATDSLATAFVDLGLRDVRVRRRDLTLGPVVGPDSALRGAIAGVVTSNAGGPVANARVTTNGVTEARTGNDGRFTLRTVPLGTRQVEVQAVGLVPAVVAIDVAAGQTTTLSLELSRVTTLDVVQVRGTPRAQRNIAAFEERRRSGLGYAKDSTAIRGLGTIASVFEGVPGVTVRRTGSIYNRFLVWVGGGGRECVANLFIDGVRQHDYEPLTDMRPTDIAAMEVYPRELMVPNEFQVSNSHCGAVAIWTKLAFR